MQRMEALEKFDYRQVTVMPGQKFDVDEGHVRALELVNKAKKVPSLAPAPAVPAAPPVATKETEPAAQAADAATDDGARREPVRQRQNRKLP